jgi:hypothetical protein
MFPLILLVVLLFIIPFVKYCKKYFEIRQRTQRINQMHVHDNRFVERDRKATWDQLGRCNLLGWSVVSILILPITLIIFILPILIVLLIWSIVLLLMLWNLFKSMICCCKKRRRPNPETIMQ